MSVAFFGANRNYEFTYFTSVFRLFIAINV